jgi:hypothetical protein
MEGSATTSATLHQMAGWLGTAIEAKLDTMEPTERARTIVALDAHDWARDVLESNVVSALSTQGLNPAQLFGLGGIVIAGTQSSNSTWIPGRLG